MDTKEILRLLPGLLGGIAIFLYGMFLLGEGLQKVAGERLRYIIGLLTTNPFMGILVGMVVTALIQSSSATTVMVVGFVSAGLMTLKQAMGVIMGANIGTTITAWLVTIDIGDYALPLIALGFILFFFVKNRRIKYVGQIIFAFGLLFFGLNIMGDIMAPLSKSREVEYAMLQVGGNKWLGVLIGTVATAVIQSSSATIAILQKLASQTTAAGEALMSLEAAIPIMYGCNIGTTITALLASIGASTNAKRAAIAHSVIKIIGAFIFIWLIGPLNQLVNLIMGNLSSPASMDTAIAISHTVFNISITILFLPLTQLLVKLVTLYKGRDELTEKTLIYIGDKISSPTVAMEMAKKEMLRMAKIVQKMVNYTKEVILEQKASLIPEVEKMEDTVDMLQHEILNYLSKILSQSALTEGQSVRLTGYMRMIHDFERIGDHCDSSTMLGASNIENKLQYSESALIELKEVFEKIENVIQKTVEAFENNDENTARNVLSEENSMDNIEKTLRERHLERLNKGECNPNTAITYVELIHTLERMTDNCKNIAESVMDDIHHKLSAHYSGRENVHA
ncbi:MAG: Na/Pi cotransporter family protein [Clostridiaceae bacterium]|nr:Na/Pi cotransporter family protein [Clostridiaceae bacterium]